MNPNNLLTQISQKQIPKEDLAAEIIAHPENLPVLFEGLSADKANTKYGCSKILQIISEKAPDLLYPQFDFFVSLLDSENNVFKWTSIFILGKLTAVDQENRFDAIFEKFFALLADSVMITAGNVVRAAAEIIKNKPALRPKIIEVLLKVESATYQTEECRNVVLSHAIDTFTKIFPLIENKAPVIRLVKNQLNNPRNGTRKRAEKFLRKFKIE